MKDSVERFIANPGGHWLMLCGQSGAGKTHLCTAVFVRLSERLGLAGEYLQWNADSRRLKATALDDPDDVWNRYKVAPLLYIDDLFKCRQGQEPSDADIRLAFELLDHRYNNQLITILSSEWTFDKLLATDQAIGSRIRELCGPYLISITPDPAKNYRLTQS
jgi:DNA replication protein DnaC